ALFKTSLNSPVILLKIYYEKHGTSSYYTSVQWKIQLKRLQRTTHIFIFFFLIDK
ncbi:hypothetical protein MKW94_025724, partial [Papaver nudicaule]|nr:hypothetical protein [Papaver nudicaule]